VINFDSTRFAAHEIRLTRRVGRSRADDHEEQMTSLAILVISCSNNLGAVKAL